MSAVERAHSLVGGSPPDPVRERLGTIEAWAKDVERRASGGHGWDTVTSRDGRDSDTEGDPGGDGEEGTTSLADMKRALRQNFINTGVIEDVTARLRRQFISEVRRKGLGVPGAREAVAARCRSAGGISLRERVLNSLVVDHLTSNGFLQSLAIFLPESGLGNSSAVPTAASDGADGEAAGRLKTAALSREDVLRGLPVPPESVLFQRVIRRVEGEGKGDVEKVPVCGLLDALLAEVATRSSAVAVDTNTQTDEAGRSHKENLATRLEGVREAWLKRAADERREPARDVTERMLAFQRECEARAAAQVKAELETFRERELSALRLQMNATQRRELDAARKELQARYDARVERLQEVEAGRERRNAERLRDAEMAQFDARQNLLRELDLVRAREQEVRRGAELDARAIRAEEHRLRDLAVSLEARAEEVRRLERGGARGREAALEAAKHEARQALEVREEGIAREREFLRQEMEAVRAERKACQEQLSQHAETARALQEARSEALAQEARGSAAEANAERAAEHAAVYREAYEMHREVAVEGDHAYVRLGRAELEEALRSTEAALEKSRGRHAEAIRRAVVERDALKAEVERLRERERLWEEEATELRRALSSAEMERDGAERRADEEECERTALDSQVEELRVALRRSRDAIEAIRLCDVEAEAPSRAPHPAPAATTVIAAGGNPACDMTRPSAKMVVERAELPSAWRPRFGAIVGKGVGGFLSPGWCEFERPQRSLSLTGFVDVGGAERWSIDCGRKHEQPRRAASRRSRRDDSPSTFWTGVASRQPELVSGIRFSERSVDSSVVSGYWSEGANAVADAVKVKVAGVIIREGWSGQRDGRPARGNSHTASITSGGGAVSSCRQVFDENRRRRSCYRVRRRARHNEEEAPSSDATEGQEASGELCRSNNRPSSAAPAAPTRSEIEAIELAKAAERLLAAEAERMAMARELEADRASLRKREEAAREQERSREREAERLRREEAEVAVMQLRLAVEEDKAAAVATAARRMKARLSIERLARGEERESCEEAEEEPGRRRRRGRNAAEEVLERRGEELRSVVAPTLQEASFKTQAPAGSINVSPREEALVIQRTERQQAQKIPAPKTGKTPRGLMATSAPPETNQDSATPPEALPLVAAAAAGMKMSAWSSEGASRGVAKVLEEKLAPAGVGGDYYPPAVKPPPANLSLATTPHLSAAAVDLSSTDHLEIVVAVTSRTGGEGVGGAVVLEQGKTGVDNGSGCGGNGDGGVVPEEIQDVEVDTSVTAKAEASEADREVEAFREKIRQRRQQRKQHLNAPAEADDAAVGDKKNAPQRHYQRSITTPKEGSVSGLSENSTGTMVELEVGGGNQGPGASPTTPISDSRENLKRDLDEVGASVDASSSVGGSGRFLEAGGSTGVGSVVSGGGSVDDWF